MEQMEQKCSLFNLQLVYDLISLNHLINFTLLSNLTIEVQYGQ